MKMILPLLSLLLLSPFPAQGVKKKGEKKKISYPKLLKSVPAPYPEAMRKAGKEADVKLVLSLDKDGKVLAVTVKVSAGKAFDEAAKNAARRCLFRPATLNGVPVPSKITVTYPFLLKGKPEAPPQTSQTETMASEDGRDDSGPAPERLFYHGQDYGSESQFGPLNVFVNVGLGVVGRLNASARLSDIDFRRGFEHLGTAYFDPKTGIRQGYGSTGVWAFTEFFPILGISSYPNYALHFLGEGMLSRKLEEYYRAHDISPIWSKLLAIASITAAQTMNEIIEQTSVTPGDALADLVFNTLGVLAFSFDGVARLFANKYVQLYYWPDQPVIDVRDSALFNHGENYLLRTTLGGWTSWKLAIAMGISYSGIGTSIPITNRDYLTIGAFFSGSNLPRRDYVKPKAEPIFYWDHENQEFASNGVHEDPSAVTTVRAFWDRRGSLMASIAVGIDAFYLGVNVYPGVLDLGPVKIGAYAAYSARAGGTAGVTLSVLSVVPGYRF